MILETTKKQFSGHKVRFGSKEYTFDNKGKLNIEDEKEAKELVAKYDHLFEEGKLPITDEKGKELDPADEETLNHLNEQLKLQKQKVEDRDKKIEKLKLEVQDWKNKVDELLNGEKVVEIETPEKVTEEGEETTEEEDLEDTNSEDLKATLEEKSFDDLKAIYKESGKSLQGIKTKEQIINKLLELDKE
jgi:hypothetical protein